MHHGPTNVGYHCWVRNMTKRDILIGDLGARIPAMKTIDLLDDYHSIYTVEKVRKSLKGGSLAARLKAKQIVIRQSAPESTLRQIEISQISFPNKANSLVVFEEKHFEELEFGGKEDEEMFAEEMAESAVIDHAATIDLLKDNKGEPKT